MKPRYIISAIILLLAAILLIGWSYSHHVVKTDAGTIILKKHVLTFHDTYIDIRPWSYSDFDQHPDLKTAMANQGYRDILNAKRDKEFENTVQGVGDDLEKAARHVGKELHKAVKDLTNEPDESRK